MNPNENDMNQSTGDSSPQPTNNQEQVTPSQNNMKVNYKDDKMEASVEMPMPEKHRGGLIGAVIIVIILIVGGLYFWGKQINNAPVDEITAEEIATTPDEKTSALETQGTSDVVANIEADLDITNLNDLDTELGNIDAELNF